MKFKFSIRKTLREIFDWGINEERVCRDYRKKISKKINHLNLSDKKSVLKTADQEFLNKVLALEEPWKDNYMTHFDRYYLSNRLDCVQGALDVMNNVEKQKQIQLRRNNIKLVQAENK